MKALRKMHAARGLSLETATTPSFGPSDVLVRVGICCGAGPHHVRAMAEALGREVPASKYSPSMDLHPMFRADVAARNAAFLHSWA